jgi:hypothetical protein
MSYFLVQMFFNPHPEKGCAGPKIGIFLFFHISLPDNPYFSIPGTPKKRPILRTARMGPFFDLYFFGRD